MRGRHAARIAGVVAVVAGLALAPITATAGHCSPASSRVGLNSAWQTPTGTLVQSVANPHPFPACTTQPFVPQETVDSRLIPPGTTHVAPAYLADLGSTNAVLSVTLHGMGFSNKTTSVTRTDFGGAWLYSGPYLKIPSGAATTGGTITVTVTIPGGSEASTFKTAA